MRIEDVSATSAMAAEVPDMKFSGDLSALSDAFDGSAEPVIYMSDNRMPVMIEFSSAIIYIVFAALLLAFLIILPGVRRTKLTSFLGLVALLTMGASIFLALEGTHWLTASAKLYDIPYGALTSETITGKLEINIGLISTNVTLVGRLSDQTGQPIVATRVVDYNERFHWDKPDRMESEHIEALRKGLPYPILTVTEFLSQDADGFNWMRKLRQAGHFSSLALYTTLASWCITSVIMCVLPKYFPHMLQITGALMMSSVWIYALLIQSPKSFSLQLGGSPIEFVFGFTYVTTFLAGALSTFAGVVLYILQASNPHKQVTIMDLDQYVDDQKAFYGGELFRQSSKSQLIDEKPNKPMPVNSFTRQNRSDSVIIPIGDIEEHFKAMTMKTKE